VHPRLAAPPQSHDDKAPSGPTLPATDTAHQERRATWSELFCDLAYVVAVAQVAHGLKQAPTAAGVAAFAVLFVPVWWSWIGITFYADRFDSDNVVDRLLLALHMLVVAALAVQLHEGTGANAPGFALVYGVLRLLLILQYARVHWRLPAARPLARRYMAGFSLAVLPWLASIFVAPPLRFALWAAGLIIDLVTPLTARAQQAALPLSPSHLPERFGLFTIIVLGESLVAVVGGVAEQHQSPASVLTAVLAFCFAFGIWWLYFDNVSHSIVHRTRFSGQTWVYMHLILMMGLTASGAGAERLINSPPGEPVADSARWLFCAATASCFVSLGTILLATAPLVPQRPRRQPRPTLLSASAGVMLLIAAQGARLRPFLMTGSAGLLTALVLLAMRALPRPTPKREPD
jgi:low temperature requirement protein LtrA